MSRFSRHRGRLAPCALVAALVVATLTACGRGGGDGSGKAAGCKPVQRQQAQFPANHILPGSAEPRYLSEPPTSGPHITPSVVPDVYPEPIIRPVQVGLLELGNVLVQFRDPAAAAGVAALAGSGVVAAPNPDLDVAFVLSAWLYLQACDQVDETIVNRFRVATQSGTPTSHVS